MSSTLESKQDKNTMDVEERRGFYEKLYFHELEVRDKIEGRLKLPMASFVITSGMAVYLYNSLLNTCLGADNNLLSGLYLGGLLFLAISIYFFIRAWFGYTYKMIPDTVSLENYYQEILEKYSKASPSDAIDWTSEAFSEYLLTTFRDYSAHNTVNNDKKAHYLHRSISTVLLSFLLYVSCYYPYYQ
jgi:hypothetical protein|tara:strand:- start:4473 stop:5033 length:561 start_codon:yes stop_codon:yes gene_type:complete